MYRMYLNLYISFMYSKLSVHAAVLLTYANSLDQEKSNTFEILPK